MDGYQLGEVISRLKGHDLERLAWTVRHQLQSRLNDAQVVLPAATHRRYYRLPVLTVTVLGQIGVIVSMVYSLAQVIPSRPTGYFLRALIGFDPLLLFWPSLFLFVGGLTVSRLLSPTSTAVEELRGEITKARTILHQLDAVLTHRGGNSDDRT